MPSINNILKKLDNVKDFTDNMITQDDTRLLSLLQKEWKKEVSSSFYRRKFMGLKTSNRLINGLLLTIPERNKLHYETRLLYRNKADGEGGACMDYASILYNGYSGKGMGKWLARSSRGRLIDKQLKDFEGNPVGTHGMMPPYLKKMMDNYKVEGGKIITDYIATKFKKYLGMK